MSVGNYSSHHTKWRETRTFRLPCKGSFSPSLTPCQIVSDTPHTRSWLTKRINVFSVPALYYSTNLLPLQAVFWEDSCSELAITSQQFHPLFPPIPVLSCQNESSSTLHCERQLPRPVITKLKKGKKWAISSHLSQFVPVWIPYEVWERFL